MIVVVISLEFISSHPALACRASGEEQFQFLMIPNQEEKNQKHFRQLQPDIGGNEELTKMSKTMKKTRIQQPIRMHYSFPSKHKMSLSSCHLLFYSCLQNTSDLIRFGLIIYIKAARMVINHLGLLSLLCRSFS